MKHDEKKIEEGLKSLPRKTIKGYWYVELGSAENKMKEYAEHMVQQERDRILAFYMKNYLRLVRTQMTP